MQPLKITINGNFWDVQIYKDRLYLWDMNGDLSVYNWDESLGGLYNNDKFIELPIICGFSRGDYLYNSNFNLIYEDSAIKDLILKKFKKASKVNIDLDLKSMELRNKQANPFLELQADSEIYYNNMYAATRKGLFSATAHRSDKKYPVNARGKLKWDCPNVQSIKAHSKRLSLSAGSDGLFELFIDKESFYPPYFKKIDDKIVQLSEQHSLVSTYAFSSIYNTSDIKGSFLIANYWENDENSNNLKLKFDKIYYEEDIFTDNNSVFSWAENEKIYCIGKNEPLKVIKFTQGNINKNNNIIFESLKFEDSLNVLNDEEIISADVAQFGTIIEHNKGLTILQSDGEKYRINGDITRWRVYPRSKRYMNHLHVILNDRIEIYSFNHDYFVEQNTKIYGIKPVNEAN